MNVRVLVIVLVVGVLAILGLTAVYFTIIAEPKPPETPAPPPPPPDTDNDGINDPEERAKGTDPNDPTRYPGSHVMILVAAGEIGENVLLAAEHLREVERAKGDYPEGTFLVEKKSEALGKITRAVIRDGEPITSRHIFSERRLAYLIPRFMRAISFNYDELAAIGGMLKPGDFVDIMGYFTVPERGNEQYSKIFVQGAKVLGIGQDLGFPKPPPDTAAQAGGAPPPPPPPTRFVTFALTPREAELLFWAEKNNPGNLRYALRSPLQSLEAVTEGQTTENFYGLTLMRRPHRVEVFVGAREAKEVSVDRVED